MGGGSFVQPLWPQGHSSLQPKESPIMLKKSYTDLKFKKTSTQLVHLDSREEGPICFRFGFGIGRRLKRCDDTSGTKKSHASRNCKFETFYEIELLDRL